METSNHTRRLVAGGASKSEAAMFRQYAEEAMRWASESNTEQEKRTLMELVCTWTLAATESERAACKAA